MPLICTFNANNLYARYRFGQTFPGDRARRSLVENKDFGYLPQYSGEFIQLFNPTQRELAARAITNDRQTYPDVICIQEVESLLALRKFNEEHLEGKYAYATLIDSRDFRQIDVAILSQLKILNVRTHVDDLDWAPDNPNHPWLFSRDCLEVDIALNNSGNRRLTLFINHLKSKFASSVAERTRADALRLRQAQTVRDIVWSRFPDPEFNSSLFAVIGDLNDEPGSTPVRSLVREAGLEDALTRLPREDRWTHWFRSENTVSQLDYILLSPALAAETPGIKPRIERQGIGFSRTLRDGKPGPKVTYLHHMDNDPRPTRLDFRFPRFLEVSPEDYASDHCPVFFEIP